VSWVPMPVSETVLEEACVKYDVMEDWEAARVPA